MKITDITIDGFGVWKDLKLRKLSPELTVFYGQNEAGKTTLLQFLRSMLYGVSPERRERYLPPVEGGRPGGRLGMLSDAGAFETRRYAERGDDDRGLVSVHMPNGETQGDRLLRDALEGVDEPTFNNVFAVGLDEIQELGTLSGSEAAKSIYRLTSGLDRVSLYDVIQGLRDSRQHLLDHTGAKSVIADLVTRREALQTKISDLTAQNRRWSKIAVELDEINVRVEETRAQLKETERAARRYEVAIGLKPAWIDRSQVDDELIAYADLYRLKDNAIAELNELNDQIEEHRRQCDILRGQRKQLKEESAELGVNEVLVRNGCRLDALEEQQEWLEALERDSEDLEEEVEKLAARLESENQRLAKMWDHDPEHAPELTRETVDELKPQADALAAAERDVEQSKRTLDAKLQSELRYRSKIETATAEGDKLGLPTDIKSAGELVARLRRRLQVEQRLEQTRRQTMDLEQQSQDLLDRQLMPMELFAFLCGAAVLSAVLLGLFFFGQWYPESSYTRYGNWAALIGLGGPLLIALIKYMSEESAAEQLDSTQRQLEISARETQEALREQKELDVELSMPEGSVVLQLQKAEKHLAELDQMLPVETQRRQADQEATMAENDFGSQKQRLAKAITEWKSSLRALGLPDRLTAEDLQRMAEQYEKQAQLQLQAENRLEDAQRRQRELAKVTQRIESLAEEADLVVEDASPLEQLDALLSERRLQQSRIEHRQKLLDRSKQLREKSIKHSKEADSLELRRTSWFRTAGVENEAAYRQLADDLATAAKLRDKRERLTREISAAIGRLGTEEDFAPLMAADRVGKLDRQWEELSSEQETFENELRDLLARRGSLAEQQKTLAEDTSLAERQMELDVVDAKLAEAKERWRERAVVGQLLELIRSDYEANRQPETLLEASKHLNRLTKGRYPRVWTPLANDILLVDDGNGVSMAVESLSRGTREQLFLSVRMAMVAMFARRGVQLPMILDDVLVNFDDGRSRVAAEVLSDFAAQGHQLLVFTCHEHVWDMFKHLAVDVRRLPDRYEDEVLEAEPIVDEVDEEFIEEAVEEVEEVVLEAEPQREPEPVRRKKRKKKVKREPLPAVVATYEELLPEREPLEYVYGELKPKVIETVVTETVPVATTETTLVQETALTEEFLEQPLVEMPLSYEHSVVTEHSLVSTTLESEPRQPIAERWSYQSTEPTTDAWTNESPLIDPARRDVDAKYELTRRD